MIYKPCLIHFPLMGDKSWRFWWAVRMHEKRAGVSAEPKRLVRLYYPRWYRVFVLGGLS